MLEMFRIEGEQITLTLPDGTERKTDTVEAHLLFAILEQLRTAGGDVATLRRRSHK